MRPAFVTFCILLFSSFVGMNAYDRNYPNGLVVDSVDPFKDSVAICKVRAKMDSIRLNEGRPTVALVLCGGGAKGAAEVGALRLIEEMKIPVDLICGTSIGSLLGGLYSVGYDQAFLENLMRTGDWDKLLSDKVDNKYFSIATKDYKSTYPLSIPFHYAKNYDKVSEVEYEEYSDRDGHLHMNDKNANLSTRTGMNALMSSLPSGYVYGFNVNNLFSSLTLGYHDSMDYADLPIPFCCVSTDLVSCKAKNLTSGHLKQSMRSSMGIPGLFSPVRIGNMVLVDGGMRNNFPVDLARAMGADYIIGIDLTDKYAEVSDVNNVGTLLSQMIAMTLRDSYEVNLKNVDVCIRPDLNGYTSLSFSTEAVDTLIRRGYEAALLQKDALAAIKAKVPQAETKRRGHLAVNLKDRLVSLSAIVFDGLSDNDSRYLQRSIGLDITKKVSCEDIERAMSIIQATGTVESVTYSLLGTDEPYRLVFSCNPAPVHRIGVSARFDTECWAEIGLNLGLNVNRPSGAKLDLDLKVGKSQKLNAHFRFEPPGLPAVNVDAQLRNSNMNQLYGGFRFESNCFLHRERVYFSLGNLSHKLDFKAGIRNMSYRFSDERAFSLIALDTCLMRGSYLGAFIEGRVNTMDKISVPSRGVNIKLSYINDFVKWGLRSFTPVRAVSADLKFVVPLGSRLSFIPDLHLRNLIDRNNNYYTDTGINESYSPAHKNLIGGDIAGRYADHQIPFVGFSDVLSPDCETEESLLDADHIGVVNLDLRCEVFNKFYLSLLGGWAHYAETFDKFISFKSKDLFAGGIQALYDTIAGPVKLRACYSNRTNDVKKNISVYLSVGLDF